MGKCVCRCVYEKNSLKLRYLNSKMKNIGAERVSCQKLGPVMVVVSNGMKKLRKEIF